MAQTHEYNIKQEMQNLILNYPNCVIRAATDWNVITIGRIQIENLDWHLVPTGLSLQSLMMYDPYDCMFRHAINGDGNDIFRVTKYGLSYREKQLTLASHNPLWNTDTTPKQQAEIMAREMVRMQKEGAKKNVKTVLKLSQDHHYGTRLIYCPPRQEILSEHYLVKKCKI